MRAVLGLFLPDELKGEERLAELQRQKEQLEKDIEEKRREPQWRVNLYDQQLRQRLQSLMPEETDIDTRPFRSTVLIPEDLERLTDRAVNLDQPVALIVAVAPAVLVHGQVPGRVVTDRFGIDGRVFVGCVGQRVGGGRPASVGVGRVTEGRSHGEQDRGKDEQSRGSGWNHLLLPFTRYALLTLLSVRIPI